jgi:hypothetical protein
MSDNQERYYGEIQELKDKLTHLLENCLGNMAIKDMEQISSRMKVLMKQGIFWIKAENPQRFAYDMREFVNWLIEFIADKEREFWNE